MAKMFPKAGLGKIKMPKRYAQGGNVPIANPKAVPKPPRSDADRFKELERQRREEEMDRRMREASERFRRGRENDSPGYKSGGSIKKYAEGGFASAFKKARDAGEDEFTWNGKQYTTRREGEGEEYKEKNAAQRRARSKPEVSDEVTISGGRDYSDVLGPDRSSERLRNAKRDTEMGQTRRGDSGQQVGPRTRDRGEDYDRLTQQLAAAQMGPIAAAGTAGIGRGMAGGRAAIRSLERGAMQEADVMARASGKRAAEMERRQRRLREQANERREAAEERRRRAEPDTPIGDLVNTGKYGGYKSGGSIKAYAKGGRIDGVATKGKTRGRII